MSQGWRDAVFLHWEVDPDAARALLPEKVEPDLFDARTYVGLIGLRIRVALLGMPIPYFGGFPEINVRLYSVDPAGRRGIVFRSLDAGRLLPAVAGREGYRLPYMWAHGAASRQGELVSYAARRIWPVGSDGPPGTRFRVRVGERLAAVTPLQNFLTARWSLHWEVRGRPLWCAAAHEPWPLYAADLLDLDDSLIAAAGLPAPQGSPASVLYSPGVWARIGPPLPLGSGGMPAVSAPAVGTRRAGSPRAG